jgi:putative membrane protein
MRLIIALPFLAILVLFALSNPRSVQLSFWPTDYALEVPLSLAILVAAGIAFLIGGFLVWLNELGQRRRARHAEQHVRHLEEQVRELKARLSAPAMPPAS